MKKSLFLIGVLFFLVGTSAFAQMIGKFEIDPRGGVALNSLQQYRGLIVGFGGGVDAYYSTLPSLSLGVGADFHNFDTTDGDLNYTFVDFMAIAKYRVLTTGINPYLLGGAGLSVYTVTVRDLSGPFPKPGTPFAQTYPALEIGGGVELDLPDSSLSIFLQSKYTVVLGNGSNVVFAPIELGVRIPLLRSKREGQVIKTRIL